MNVKNIFISLLVISVVSLFIQPAVAQDEDWTGLGVSYLGRVIYVSPGVEFNDSFTVINHGEQPQRVEISTFDWDRDIYGNERYYTPPGELPRSLAKYLTFYPTMMELGPGESEEVNFTIKTEEPGCHWILFFVKGSIPIKKETGVIKSKEGKELTFESETLPAMGVTIWQVDPTDEIVNGKVVGMEVEQSPGEVLVKILFENNGTVPLRPRGWVELRNVEAETIANVDIKWFRVLPYGARRLLEVSINVEGKLKPDEKCLTLGVIDYGAEQLVAGQKTFIYKGGS